MYILIWEDDTKIRVYTSKFKLKDDIRRLELNHTNYYKKNFHLKKYMLE